LFHETYHRFTISQFHKRFRFACFAKSKNAKQIKRFAKRLQFSHVSLFCEIEISRCVKTLAESVRATAASQFFATVSRNIPFLLFQTFREMFRAKNVKHAKIREIAVCFTCFAVSRNKNALFRQKPLSVFVFVLALVLVLVACARLRVRV
jgi:hypothetical protein